MNKNQMSVLLIIDAQNAFKNEHTDCLADRIRDARNKIHPDKVIWTRFIDPINPFFKTVMNPITDEDLILVDDPELEDYVIDKHGYSAITPVFEQFLKNYNPQTIYICGCDTDACILSTCFDLFERNIGFKVIRDACMSSAGTKLNDAAFMIIQRNFGDVII